MQINADTQVQFTCINCIIIEFKYKAYCGFIENDHSQKKNYITVETDEGIVDFEKMTVVTPPNDKYP